MYNNRTACRFIYLAAALCSLFTALAAAAGVPALRVGSETDFPPYADIDSQGQAIGFSVELFAAAAAAADVPVEFVPGHWDTLWQGLLRGEIDALPLVARLPERAGLAEFTNVHTSGFDAFFMRKGQSAVATIAEASKLRIIVMRSDAAHDALVSRGLGSQLVLVDTLADGFRLLASGQHDVLLAPIVQGVVQSDMMGLGDEIDHGPMLQEYRREFCFAVAKGNTELRDRLQQGLDTLKANGEYQRLYRKWLGVYEPSSLPRKYAWAAAALLAIVGLLIVWTWTLRRQVAARTTELKAHRDNLEQLVAERTRQLGKAMANQYLFVKHAPASMAMFDREMNYRATSDQWAKEYECGRFDLVGLNLYDFNPDMPEAWNEARRRALAGETVKNEEDLWCRADGSRRWLRWVVLPWCDSDGTIGGVIVLSEDVTSRKRLEQELIAARDSAQAATAAKTAFLANMSHEIRTPLHVITGLAHLMRRHVKDAGMMHRLDQVCANSDHLLALVSDILDMSKIEAGELSLDCSPFRLQSVVDQVLSVVAVPARTKGLAMLVEVAPNLRDAALQGDPLRLAQVLINLCSNATKFTDRGFVRLGVAGGTNGESVSLTFAVEDTGCGIPSEAQASVFQPFKQGDDSITRERGGTGLGLTISQRLVALMGGSIRLESLLGKGSCFEFDLVLPTATADDQTGATELLKTVVSVFGKARVLLADDHPISQEIVFEMLGDLGCAVDLASDGVEAVARARERQYNLILMDIQMPRMDGLAATKAIRALPGYRRTPIVALTANAFAEDRRQCLRAGMDDHIGKPVTPTALAESLRRWLPGVAVPTEGPPDDDGELAVALRAIPGLDVPGSWRRSPEHLSSYCEQLRRFVSRHHADFEKLREYVAADDHCEAQRLVHDLKGVAGLIGARKIAACATTIEKNLRSGDFSAIELQADECRGEMSALAAGVATLPAAAAPQDA